MGDSVFMNCKALFSIIIKSKVPPVYFGKIEKIPYVFVPEESTDIYRSNKQWCEHNIRPMIIDEWGDDFLISDEVWDDDEWRDDDEDIERMEIYLQRNERNQEDNEWDIYEREEDIYQRDYDSYYEDYQNYPWYQEDYNWLIGAAGTDDPEVMNDVYWNID